MIENRSGIRVCVRTGSETAGPSTTLPGFPVEACGVGELHEAFFTESRTCGHVQCCVAGNPGALRSAWQFCGAISSQSSDRFWDHFHATELSSRPERTRISYIVTPPAATYAASRKESRMKFANASNLHRKSGVAEWRDLLFLFRFSRRL